MATKHALILAGGRSRRFGSDKTALSVNGKTLLSQLVENLNNDGCDISVLGPKHAHLLALGCRVIPDKSLYDGALVAIADAMELIKCDAAFVVAADMPFPNLNVIQLMWSQLNGYRAVFLENATLPAIYSASAIPVMRSLLESSERRLGQLNAATEPYSHYIPKSLWSSLDPQEWTTRNINFPEDWECCRNILSI
ncbi:MAG: hypothetical protein COV45_01295 [Deltaproteobacteria bacterium CG11_big_fil_rev_8_21_14_0_20_47_16]|nr:MAG: hypothetical protein COV45_01295 [Deltaproteobacteria bacterium CG11_big_fil_rev_8_21_14_0_20_47_16]